MYVTESRSSMSEMLPSQSNRKESSCSVDDDVFGGSNTMKKSENTPGKNNVAKYVHRHIHNSQICACVFI